MPIKKKPRTRSGARSHKTGAGGEEEPHLFASELQNSCFQNLRFTPEPRRESMEDPWSSPPALPSSPTPRSLCLRWRFCGRATKSGLQLLSTSVLPFSFRSPLAPLVTSYHRQSPAALFTLGAVGEMCHRDVMLHTPGDKNRQTLFTHAASVSSPTTTVSHAHVHVYTYTHWEGHKW